MKEFFIWCSFAFAVVFCSATLAACLTLIEVTEREQLKRDIREIVKNELEDGNNG